MSSRPSSRSLLALSLLGGVGLLGALLLGLPGADARADLVGVGGAEVEPSAFGAQGDQSAPLEASTQAPEVNTLTAVDLPECDGVSATDPSASKRTVDPRTREVAQDGLQFLSTAAVAWQEQHACFGCHVQAVTTEALAVGMGNGYGVSEAVMASMTAGLTTINGGARAQGGFQYHGGTLLLPSKAFGGAALARYDRLVGNLLTDDLLAVAAELKEYQADDGAVRDPGGWVNLPVGQGELQFTWQAIATWRQAYERSADPAWLTPVAQAEDWLHGQVRVAATDPSLQPTTYVLLGLADAGASTSEARVLALVDDLLARQDPGGGWAKHRGGQPDAFATGQALVTLRTVGLGDGHPAVDAGTAWLLSHQESDGSWGHGGDEKATAMWAVLGLVSVDTVHMELSGLERGAHVEGMLPVSVTVSSNETEEGGVREVHLAIDDVVVAASCGGRLEHLLDTSTLASGPHVVDVVATGSSGRVSRQRLDLYTGNHFLVDLGSGWDDGGTLVSFRDLAPASRGGSVRMVVRPLTQEEGKEPVVGEVIATMSLPSSQGAMQFWWDGAEVAKAGLGADTRFRAELSWLDSSGAALQTSTTDFVHADPAQVAQWYGEVGGKVDLPDARGSANTWVELVDQAGNVLDRVRTTREGQYRFKEVKGGEYKVRVEKEGFGSTEAPVMASPNSDVEQDLEL